MLRLVGVTKTYGQGTATEVTALAGISVDVRAGEFVTLIGSNGAGKSTLLKTVVGLVTPDAGRVELDGRDVTREAAHARAQAVGRIAQDPQESTCAGMTIEENLAMPPRYPGRTHRISCPRDDPTGRARGHPQGRDRPGVPRGSRRLRPRVCR